MLLSIITEKPRIVLKVCKLLGLTTVLMYLCPELSNIGYIVEEPVNVFMGLFISVLFPYIPFAILSWHYALRCQENGEPSLGVLLSILVSCFMIFLASVYFCLKYVYSNEWGSII